MTDQQAGLLGQLSDELAAAVERAGRSTVTVFARDRMPATGVTWGTDGRIVTANHVVERDEGIEIGLQDGRTVPAVLAGRDGGSDLALLRVEASGLVAASPANGPAVPGQLVLAIGRPGPSGAMASFGVVSLTSTDWRGRIGGPEEGFIRADVAMLPGFSGGPLVDACGAVLGINSTMLGRVGGVTIPTAAVDRIVAGLEAGGAVRQGALGMGAQPVTVSQRMADMAGISPGMGLLVASLEPNGPAERDGLIVGDIVLSLDGDPVATVDAVHRRLTGETVGKPVTVRLLRGGALEERVVTIGARP